MMKIKSIIFLLALWAFLNAGTVWAGAIKQLSKITDTSALYYEQSANITIDEYGRYLRVFDALPNESMRRSSLKKLEQLKQRNSRIQRIVFVRVVSVFEALIKRYPLENNEQLIYQFSVALEESGRINEAFKRFNQLLKAYPKTRLYDKAQFHKAEVLYYKQQYIEAEKLYAAVIAYTYQQKKSSYYEQAVYKQGWTQFKQTRYTKAENSFMHLLDLHVKNNAFELGLMSLPEKNFVRQVMQAIVLSFSYQAGPYSAYHYFFTNKRAYEYHVFLSLAKYYQQKNNVIDAVKTYELFVALNKTHVMSPVFLLNIISLYKQGGFSDLEWKAKKNFVLQYNIDHVYWGLYDEKKTARQLMALNINLYQLARHFQRIAKKNQQHVSYREALRWYRIWLRSFPKDKKAPSMHYQLAELLGQNMQYELAAIEYERAAYDFENYPNAAQAAYAALSMHEKKAQLLTGFIKKQWHEYGINRTLRFAKSFPQHEDAKKLQARAEQSLKSLARKKARSKVRNKITDEQTPERLAYDKAIAFMYARHWAQAAAAFEAFNSNFPNHALTKEVTMQLALSYMVLEKNKKAVSALVKIAYFPVNMNLQEEALWLAADLSEQVGDNALAVKIYKAFIKRFSFPLAQTIEARQRIIELFSLNKDSNNADAWRVELINAEARGEKRRTDRTRYLAADAGFSLAVPAFNRYRKMQLLLPLNKNLNLKVNMMNKAIEFYERAASYNVVEILTASTYRIAQLYNDLAVSIYQSQHPGYLKDKDRATYAASLKKKAKPYEEKAIEYHQMNIEYARQGKHSAWTDKSEARLKGI